jgi:hypothetical protein
MKCNETQDKWCKNKHGASKIIDTFETYHFSAKYSNAHLTRYLPCTIPTYCGEQDGFYNVSFTHQGNGVAQMISNWPEVLQKASIEEGNVCIFTFLNVG